MATNLSDDQLRTTLLDLNFDVAKVTRFINSSHLAAARDLLNSFVPTSKQGRQGKYQNLQLSGGLCNRNWVVFDPCKPIPDVRNDMLRLLVRFAIYKPGNNRFLEYNIRTGCFRLRSVGKVFKGKYISYTVTGPVLTSFEDESDDTLEQAGRDKKKGSGSTAGSSSGSESELTEIELEEGRASRLG